MSDPSSPEFTPPPPPPGTPSPTPPQWAPPQMPPSYQPPPPPGYSDVPTTAAPGMPGYALPPGYAPPAGYAPPTGYPQPTGYAPQPGYAPAYVGAAAGFSLMSQFSGIAMWSIILGVISVGVPIATGLTTGGSFTFFYVLPIFGIIRGFTAVTRGQVIGGILGIALNCVGGLISLFASGIL